MDEDILFDLIVGGLFLIAYGAVWTYQEMDCSNRGGEFVEGISLVGWVCVEGKR